jgi:hypothetical protein
MYDIYSHDFNFFKKNMQLLYSVTLIASIYPGSGTVELTSSTLRKILSHRATKDLMQQGAFMAISGAKKASKIVAAKMDGVNNKTIDKKTDNFPTGSEFQAGFFESESP